jgi:hypothetical protein
MDPLTNEKHPYMSSIGHGAIHQFGHPVTSQLIIRCAHPADGRTPYLSVDLLFSERVAVGDVKARLVFDKGPIHERTFGAFDSGNQFAPTVEVEELKETKKLRIEVRRPWAGPPIIEFDTTGAFDPLNRMPCKEIGAD